MLSISAAVEATANAIKGVFDFASTAKEHQAETEIIKENKQLKEAVNIAEEILEITESCYAHFSDDDWERYKKLKKKFNKKD